MNECTSDKPRDERRVARPTGTDYFLMRVPEASTQTPESNATVLLRTKPMSQDLKRLFQYDFWANREVATALGTLKTPPPASLKRLAHIVSAETLWLERLTQQKQTYPVWPEFTLDQCKLGLDSVAKRWMDCLATTTDLSQTVTYKNTKGESFTSVKSDILMHVILHSAYHRGQIAADMRAAGFTPAYTDFIHAVRQTFVE